MRNCFSFSEWLILILSVGVYFTIYTKFAQLRLFPAAIRKFTGLFKKCEHGAEGISAYRALCTALAATVGTGNIVGVAGAIALGGPGVVFWMWVCGILGMITKFAEVTLAVQYRRTNAMGKIVGGPMYMIENGLPGWKCNANKCSYERDQKYIEYLSPKLGYCSVFRFYSCNCNFSYDLLLE